MFTRSIRAYLDRLPQDLTAVLAGVDALGHHFTALSDSDLTNEIGTVGNKPEDLVARLGIAREAAVRSLGERPHDTQVLGAAAMATGRVVEMLTGEGKTLAAAMAAFALAGADEGLHVVTANDYLAARDGEWMGTLYERLGLTVGVVAPGSTTEDKRIAYECDVTYGTAREFAFDYLRDTLAVRRDDRVQRGHGAALIDEIDFVLLDEARVPFVITKSAEVDRGGLADAARVVANLDPASDFNVDEAQRATWLTEAGIDRVEASIGVGGMDDPSSRSGANVQMALRARCTLRRDRDYVVNGDRIDIVDEFTGRVLSGRRWADGLHQAVEAKEGVPILEDSRALAQTTARSYFGHYQRIVGMSGTASVAAREFKEAHGLDVMVLPPHRPVIRTDRADEAFVTLEDKYGGVLEEIVAHHAAGRPVLIGTATVEHSEYLSGRLSELGIEHRVLNAKKHAAEASIIAEAGRVGAVTVATNMAGRGVDIKLGGRGATQDERESVAQLGGLCVIGTERHESRRVDDQLRGRAGRQGDPGESVFFVSPEDDLVVKHGPKSGWSRPGVGARSPHRSVEVAQANVDIRNQEVRAATHEYDEILDNHYAELCRFRTEIVDGSNFEDWTLRNIEELGGDATAMQLHAAQHDRAGAAWKTVQRHVMYAVLERGWSTVLESMYQLRNWVNLVALGGTYPITEWRRRSDDAVAALRKDTVTGYVDRLLGAEIVHGRRPVPVAKPAGNSGTVPQPLRPRQDLPRASKYEPAFREPIFPEWAEGFAGPRFQEMVMLVDPSGAVASDGVSVVDTGAAMTVYVDQSVFGTEEGAD